MVQTSADALFILGDLFDVWVGDDVVAAENQPDHPFEMHCLQVLKQTAQRLPIFFMHGNRDFLLGHRFAKASGMTLLNDPAVLVFDQTTWLLSHGDALCLNDSDYQKFRLQVRAPAWRKAFLAKPLNERKSTAQTLRTQSEQRRGAVHATVDASAAIDWLHRTKATTLIHGHTHEGTDNELENPENQALRRLALSDWDAEAKPRRLEVLQLQLGAAPKRLLLSSDSA